MMRLCISAAAILAALSTQVRGFAPSSSSLSRSTTTRYPSTSTSSTCRLDAKGKSKTHSHNSHHDDPCCDENGEHCDLDCQRNSLEELMYGHGITQHQMPNNNNKGQPTLSRTSSQPRGPSSSSPFASGNRRSSQAPQGPPPNFPSPPPPPFASPFSAPGGSYTNQRDPFSKQMDADRAAFFAGRNPHNDPFADESNAPTPLQEFEQFNHFQHYQQYPAESYPQQQTPFQQQPGGPPPPPAPHEQNLAFAFRKKQRGSSQSQFPLSQGQQQQPQPQPRGTGLFQRFLGGQSSQSPSKQQKHQPPQAPPLLTSARRRQCELEMQLLQALLHDAPPPPQPRLGGGPPPPPSSLPPNQYNYEGSPKQQQQQQGQKDSSGDAVNELVHLWMHETHDAVAAQLLQDMEANVSPGAVREMQALQELIDQYPHWAEPKSRLALLLYFKGRTRESYDMALQALKLKPWHFECLQMLVLLSLRMQDLGRALYWARQGLPPMRYKRSSNVMVEPGAPAPAPVAYCTKRRAAWVERAMRQAQEQLQQAEEYTARALHTRSSGELHGTGASSSNGGMMSRNDHPNMTNHKRQQQQQQQQQQQDSAPTNKADEDKDSDDDEGGADAWQ